MRTGVALAIEGWARLRRAARAVRGFPRVVRQGVRNFWRFRREVWEFRGYDWSFNHALLMRSLKLTQQHIGECRNHTCWERDVADIQAAFDTFDEFENGDHRNFAEEDAAWDKHWAALGKIRNWWD